jgi:carbon storage regulator
MLALSRKPGEKVVIGNSITVTVVSVTGNKVRLAFDAPDQVRILRAELACRQGEPLDADLDGRPR